MAQLLDSVGESGTSALVNGLVGSSRSLLAADLAMASGKTVLVVTDSPDRARQFFDDLEFFIPSPLANRMKIFPASSVLPFTRLSPEPEDWADRIEVLHRLLSGSQQIIVAPVDAVMRRTPPKKFIGDCGRTIRSSDSLDPVALASFLADIGYEEVGLVEDEGTFARRGGIFDLWPPTTGNPVRIELDGTRIASMRNFDPASQRSKGDCLELSVIPVRDIPFDEKSRLAAAHRIRERSDDADLSASERKGLIEQIHNGIPFSGIETLIPLFHKELSSIFNFLPQDSTVIIDDETDVESQANSHFAEVERIAGDTKSPERIVKVSEVLLNPEEFFSRVQNFRNIRCNALPGSDGKTGRTQVTFKTESNDDIRREIREHKEGVDMLAPFVNRIRGWQSEGNRILLTCHTATQADRIKDLLMLHGIDVAPFESDFNAIFEMKAQAPRIKIGRLSGGFRWLERKLAIVTDEEIFGRKATRRFAPSRPLERFMSLSELAEGDLIVHEQHGIGRYSGLMHLTLGDERGDYLLLEYLGGDKLYLPVYRLNLIGKYIGSSDTPPSLDRLGGTRWEKISSQVRKQIRTMAKELLKIYAAREVFPGHPFPAQDVAYEEFSAAFPYDETPDQDTAIGEVMRDMSIERPMDRLICGDVGYGKTEVAMRAAFRAAVSGKQTAVLVPTTVLALQHFETFTKRFAETPVKIEMLSRFRDSKEQKRIIEDVKRGGVDIVVGTHRLLQNDVSFRDLGLLIIDEEHRFGVKHKERMKKIRSTVDVITLTATPIPRTLNLSLSGIRDISIINTPPADRLSISTYVSPFDEGVIHQAVMREIERGGQVFFVHNRVETIESMHFRLRNLLPGARIVVGHGQMKESDLEKVMIDFIERKADVLLCTTIIESGLDIPSANTIIIDRADTFGLAQLYQLRGRVGRSDKRAYAYLLTPPDGTMTSIAKKRLTVLKRFTELGSGFQIAMHDLEFRGAGNILGSAQSGHIAAVGYEMFTKLLDREIRKLTGKAVEEEIDPELHLKVPAFLPEAYVPDTSTRIDIYRRLASRESDEEIEAIGNELADRFGEPPSEVNSLLRVMEVKILAKKLAMSQITFDGAQYSCQLAPSTALKIESVVELAATRPEAFRLVPPDKLLLIVGSLEGSSDPLAALKKALSSLMRYVT